MGHDVEFNVSMVLCYGLGYGRDTGHITTQNNIL